MSASLPLKSNLPSPDHPYPFFIVVLALRTMGISSHAVSSNAPLIMKPNKYARHNFFPVLS